MLKLVKLEFCKLRRKKLIWLMLLSAFVMPFFAFLYFGYLGQTNIDPRLFYKWSAFGCTLFIILPFILGLFSTMLMHDENRYDMLKQLWIVPVSKMGYFFSKFFVVLIYSVCFMLITAFASVLFSVIPNYVVFEWSSVLFLLERSGNCCFDIICNTTHFSNIFFTKRIYFPSLHYIDLCICWIFNHTDKFLSTPTVLYQRYYCKK